MNSNLLAEPDVLALGGCMLGPPALILLLDALDGPPVEGEVMLNTFFVGASTGLTWPEGPPCAGCLLMEEVSEDVDWEPTNQSQSSRRGTFAWHRMSLYEIDLFPPNFLLNKQYLI